MFPIEAFRNRSRANTRTATVDRGHQLARQTSGIARRGGLDRIGSRRGKPRCARPVNDRPKLSPATVTPRPAPRRRAASAPAGPRPAQDVAAAVDGRRHARLEALVLGLPPPLPGLQRRPVQARVQAVAFNQRTALVKARPQRAERSLIEALPGPSPELEPERLRARVNTRGPVATRAGRPRGHQLDDPPPRPARADRRDGQRRVERVVVMVNQPPFWRTASLRVEYSPSGVRLLTGLFLNAEIHLYLLDETVRVAPQRRCCRRRWPSSKYQRARWGWRLAVSLACSAEAGVARRACRSVPEGSCPCRRPHETGEVTGWPRPARSVRRGGHPLRSGHKECPARSCCRQARPRPEPVRAGRHRGRQPHEHRSPTRP